MQNSPLHPSVQGTLRLLAEGRVGPPQVSGDGKTVVWDQLVDGNMEILRWRDGKVDQLTHNTLADVHPVVSDDGNTVAWTRRDKNGNFDVVANIEGTERVISAGPGNEYSVAISGDGKTIVWDDDHNGDWGGWDIRAWRDGRVETVTDSPGNQEFPEVNDDGSCIFWRDDTAEDGSNIWMRDRSGTIKPVVTGQAYQGPFAVTDDGSKVIFTDIGEDAEGLYIQDGLRVRPVADLDKVSESGPAVNADGSVVAWTNFDFRNGAPADTQIFLKDGEQSVQITTGADGLNARPSISDDGRTVTWFWIDNEDTGHCKIYLLERE
ncbi:MAG: hypothetical protein FJX76_06490 [Armatimonadetes bacterium]|nr:hypothetical protein [Armatimonadota bacterium]